MSKFKSVPVIFLFAAAGMNAQTVAATNAQIAAACLQAIGVDCTKDPGQSNLWSNIRSAINSKQITSPTQSYIVTQYLIPMMRANVGMQASVVDRAYQYVGATAGSAEESMWTRQYQNWQTFQQLIPLLPRHTAVPAVPAPATAQYNLQQQQQAFKAAFQSIWLRAPSSAELASMNTTVAPASMASYVRSGLRNAPGEIPRIVATVFPSAIGRQPTPYETSGITGVFGSYWTGGDDLSTYLRGTSASYRTPNYGPQTATQHPASSSVQTIGTPGSTVIYVGQSILSPSLLSAGYLLAANGSQIVAQGGGNYVDSATGLLMGRNGSPLIVGYGVISNDGGSIVAQGGGNIVAQGGGNIVAQGGGNIVAQGGGNIVAQGGGNLVALASVGSFSVYNSAAIASLLQQISAASQRTSQVQLAQSAVAGIANNAANVIGTSASNFYGIQSVGSAPQAQTAQQAADSGNGDAMYELALSYYSARNWTAAYEYFYLAESHPTTLHTYTAQLVDNYKNAAWAQMTTTAQQTQAKSLISAWQTAHPGK